MCCGLITDDSHEDDAHQAAIRKLVGLDLNAVLPQTQQFIHLDAQEALNLVRILLFGARKYPSKYKVDGAISKRIY